MIVTLGVERPKIRIRPRTTLHHVTKARPKNSIVRRGHVSVARCKAQKGRPCLHGCRCHLSGDCLGIDGYNAYELRNLYDHSDNPELMGSKIKESLQRAKKKIKTAVKKMPKPLKTLAKVAAAPLLLPAAAPMLLTKKGRKIAKKEFKSLPKPLQTALKIAAAPALLPAAAGLIPAAVAAAPIVAPKVAAAIAAKKIADARKRRVNIAQVRRKQVEDKTGEEIETSLPTAAAATASTPDVEDSEKSPAAVAPGASEQQESASAEPEKKKSIMPIAAAAALLPLLFML